MDTDFELPNNLANKIESIDDYRFIDEGDCINLHALHNTNYSFSNQSSFYNVYYSDKNYIIKTSFFIDFVIDEKLITEEFWLETLKKELGISFSDNKKATLLPFLLSIGENIIYTHKELKDIAVSVDIRFTLTLDYENNTIIEESIGFEFFLKKKENTTFTILYRTVKQFDNNISVFVIVRNMEGKASSIQKDYKHQIPKESLMVAFVNYILLQRKNALEVDVETINKDNAIEYLKLSDMLAI